MSEISSALDLLYQALKGLDNDVEIIRLNDIIIKLERFEKGEFDHPDDLTKEEKYQIELNNLKKYIDIRYDGDYDDFAGSVENHGSYNFYYSYDNIPGVSFETFEKFVNDENNFTP